METNGRISKRVKIETNNKLLRSVFRHVLLRLCPDSVLPAQLPTVASDTQKVPDETAV